VDAETTPVLRGERVVLRPVAEADLARHAAILREEEVAAWWGGYDEERARAEILAGPGWHDNLLMDLLAAELAPGPGRQGPP